MRAYKFRMYPNKKQEEKLIFTLDYCRCLYNAALQQRRDTYISAKKYISYENQASELSSLKNDVLEYKQIHSQVLQNVLKRVDLSYQGFFRRIKKGYKPGYPRFRSEGRYNSFCFPQGGFYLKSNKIELSKMGLIKIRFHRHIPLDATIKTCTIKKEGNHWYAILACNVNIIAKGKKPIEKSIGVDLGLTDFAVLSDETKIKNPKYLKQSETKLKAIQSKYSKGKSRKAGKQLTGLYRKIANQRRDFQHKLSRQFVNNYDMISYEDLKIKQMIRDNKYHLQKHIYDACWGRFISMLLYKAEEAGVTCIAVNPKGTTQLCSNCGSTVPKSLYERSHECLVCGFTSSRDYNAALNIHKLGISLVNRAMPEVSEAMP